MKLLVIGNSAKFITFIESIFFIEKKTVIPWRSLQTFSNEKIINSNLQWDIILLCGYDYSSSSKYYSNYYLSNVQLIIELLKSIPTKNFKIIYINTINPKKSYTFSRYLYAKMKLGSELNNNFNDVDIINLPTVLESGTISISGGFFSKSIFIFLIKIKLLTYVNINLNLKTNQLIYANFKAKPFLPKKIGLNIPRSITIDRLLRMLLG